MSMVTPLFEIEDLRVDTAAAEPNQPVSVLNGVTLKVMPGEIHALMGPVGSGKTALASTLLGSPQYAITSGSIRLRGDDITDWGTDVRGKAGLFLAFQYPQELFGVSVLSFLRQALSARKGIEMSVLELRLALMEWMEKLDIDPSFIERHLNEGFSEAEKKRNEILQMAVLEPEMAILDETDPDLDADALQAVAKGIREVRASRPELGTLAITQHQLLLDYLEPDVVHVIIDGKVVETGGPELTERLKTHGYDGFK